MLDFILNTLFVKRENKCEVAKGTYIRKEVGERKTPTLRTKFIMEINNEKTELNNYFKGSKGLNLYEREKYKLINGNRIAK